MHVEIHRSAGRHGISHADISHAVGNALHVFDLDPDGEPPKVLCIGPDRASNLLEVIWLDLENDRALVIHAMRLRERFFDLLVGREGQP
jgi:hypothetical protein